MKTTSKIITGIVVSGLVISGIILSQTVWANGRFITSYVNTASYGNTMKHSTSVQRDPSLKLTAIPIATLSEAEKTALIYQYREEMVAQDLYSYFATLYPDAVFSNISKSEQQHMEAVQSLLNRYSVPLPTGYGELQATFDSLKTEGSNSRQAALEVGLKVEMLDIEDNLKTIKMTDNDDIKLIFTNIGGASYNHLRGFSKALNANGYRTSVDISKYLSANEINSRGSLQNKLIDTLKTENITVPSEVTHEGEIHGNNNRSRHGQGQSNLNK